jgi:hypothetical protein
VTGESDGSGWRRMSMTFNDDASERRGRGRVKLRGCRMRALGYGECLYEAIQVGKNFLFLINKGGYIFYTMRRGLDGG